MLGRGHAGEACESCGLRASAYTAEKPLKILSISHGWLTSSHPDPLGQQLVGFAEQVRAERLRCKGKLCLDSEMQQGDNSDCLGYSLTCSMFNGCSLGHGCCCYAVPCSGQQCAHCDHQLASGEFGVFYDFASLMQQALDRDRSELEKEAFNTALATMGVPRPPARRRGLRCGTRTSGSWPTSPTATRAAAASSSARPR